MKKILKYQIYHLAVYLILGVFLFIFSNQYIDNDKILDLSVINWVYLSWIFAGIFQFWIMLFWRLELYYKKISKIFGSSGFLIFRIGFVIFGLTRFLTLIPISLLTKDSIIINYYLKITLIIVSTPFILWGIYSIIFYFGLNRAFGADHFFPEYRSKSLEKRGIFKYIRNSMYTIVLLFVYHPGLFYESSLGLVIALCHHLLVWTHYFCTEKPDLYEIYGIK